MKRRGRVILLILSSITVVGCSAVLGLDDLAEREGAAPSGTDGGGGDSPFSNDADQSSDDGAMQRDGASGDGGMTNDGSSDGAADGGPVVLEERLALGQNHVCYVLDDQTVKCWGKNDEGALGSDAGAMTATPTAVPGVINATQISAGGNSTCVRQTNGMTQCWGGTNGGYPPGNIGNIVKVSVAAGLRSCALYVNGTVGCWGSDNYDQLGGAQGGPIAVITGATSMSASDSSGYAVAGGKIYGWGGNMYGQLGLGDVSPAMTSTPIVIPSLSNMVQVAGGGTYACGLGGGKISCWGASGGGDNNALGTNETLPSNIPREVAVSVSDFVEVTTADIHACGLTSTGVVYCWGNNNLGRLGIGMAFDAAEAPTMLTAFGPATTAGPALEIHSGFGNTCARTAAHVYCWGVGTEGQGGNGIYANNYLPVMVNL